ncbi:MAG: hypothetical protein M1829_003838 [Trizodia sp. TS-e1964]|nr:MAG: hypothetical protein M1829_003838 [Trizodia sp. TS-e1964]
MPPTLIVHAHTASISPFWSLPSPFTTAEARRRPSENAAAFLSYLLAAIAAACSPWTSSPCHGSLGAWSGMELGRSYPLPSPPRPTAEVPEAQSSPPPKTFQPTRLRPWLAGERLSEDKGISSPGGRHGPAAAPATGQPARVDGAEKGIQYRIPRRPSQLSRKAGRPSPTTGEGEVTGSRQG